MSRFGLRAPSPALVISLVALFVSLGGVSYGVATGFIDSREIKNNTVRTTDLRNNDIRSTDVRNNTITARDIRTGTITGGDIRTDSVTGRDILESSLGAVPVATRATSAASVDGLVHTSPVTQSYGGADKDLFSLNGFRAFLRCAGGTTTVLLQNVSAGDNAAFDGTTADTVLDTNETATINTTTDGADATGLFTAFGTKGAITGNVGVADSATFTGAADCQANGSATG